MSDCGPPKLMDTLGCIVQKIKAQNVIRVAETDALNKLPVHAIALDANPDQKKKDELEQLSAKYRSEGNQYFKQGNYLYACNLYTRSIASALQGPICALAYANRSAALFYMCKFDECLEDIQRAINNGYEEKLLYKLYLRKARCLKLLGKDFRESYKRAHKMIEKFNKDDLPKLKKALETELKEPVQENLKTGQYYTDGNIPPLSYGTSEEVPCFSSAVSVAYSKELGRHLVANRDIKIGDVLIVEEPVAAVVDMDKTNKVCCRCFKISCSLIPCFYCQQFMYCGNECLNSDWEEGHKDECSMLVKVLGMALNIGSEQVFMGYNKYKYTLPCLAFALMVRAIGFNKMKEAVLSNEPLGESYLDPRTRGFKDGKFTFSLEALLSLTCNFDKLNTSERNSLMIYAIENVMQVPSWDDQREAMTALFIKLYLICTFNYKPITVLANFEVKAINENFAKGQKGPFFSRSEFGFALYLASSLVNHSCSPNMIKVNYGKTAVYRATKPIKKGDQLTENFYISRLLFDLKTRQKKFKKYYKFDCTCEACKNNWPVLEGLRGLKDTDTATSFLYNSTMLTKDKCIFTDEELGTINAFMRFGFPADIQIMPKLVYVINKMHTHPDCEQHLIYQHYRQCLLNHYLALGGAIFSRTGQDFFTCKQTEKFPMFADNFEEVFINALFAETVTFCSP